MTNVLKFGLSNIWSTNRTLLSNKFSSSYFTIKCNITSKTARCGLSVTNKPSPWPYKEKNYSFFNAIFDRTTHRFDDNSKIIVVEGPIAAGKSAFAKELADELEMCYMPEVNMDMYYVNDYGFDLRKLDPQLPEDCRSFDITNFCANPNHRLVASFQLNMYMLRFSQYIDALIHLLNTGQGVVLDRSVYSDFVFVETMYKHGFISQGARSVYYDIRNNTISELLKPHLVIYLDVPVKTVEKRIKERNISYETKSKVFSPAYLSEMEDIYKQKYLKEISKHAELLLYDWSDYGETEVVVEDIERIDFDRFDKHNPKMKDWRYPLEWDWAEVRMRFTNNKHDLMNYANVARYDVPELLTDPYDAKAYHEIVGNAPGMKYIKGYNEDAGDTGILTKMSVPVRDKTY